MSSVLAYRDPEAVIYPEARYEDCGDIVDDILKRIGNIEADVSKLKVDVGVIASNYATKSDIAEVKTSIAELRTELKVEIAGIRTEGKVEIAGVRTEIAGLRTELKDEIAGVRTELKGEIAAVRTSLESMEAKLIKWFVATGLSIAGLAFAAAKFVH